MSRPTVREIQSWPAVVPLYPDAASALGVGRSAIYAIAQRGDIPVLRLGRQIRVSTAALLALLGAPLSAHDETPAA